MENETQVSTSGNEAGSSAAPGSATTNTDSSVKSEGAEGKAGAPDSVGGQTKTGQGEQPPEGSGTKDSAGKEADLKKAAWNEQHTRWLQSKHLDMSKIDPANPAHMQLVESAVNAEAAMSKTIQEAKASQMLEEVKKKAEQAPPPIAGSQSAPKTPLERFEQNFEERVGNALGILGFKDVNELLQNRPDLYQQFNEEYRNSRQVAWEETQKWKSEQAAAAEAATKSKMQLENNYRQMQTDVKNHFDTARAKNPAFDTLWRESGVENILSWMDKTFVLPREMVLQNPEIFKLFSDFASAMEYRRGESDREKGYRQKWEKEVLEAKRDTLPPISGQMVGDGARDPMYSGAYDWTRNLPPYKQK